MIGKLLKMQSLGDDEEFVSTVTTILMSPTRKSPTSPRHDGRPVWMRTLYTTATEWLSMIPEVRLATAIQEAVQLV